MALHNTHFRKMVFSTAEKLTALECSSLHYIYALPEKYRDCSNLEILKELQRKGCYSNAEGLAQILKGIHREDLAKEVYCASGPTDGSTTSHGHKTPTQLRGKCDANIAQTNSLAKELKKIRNSFLDNGLAQSAMDDLYRELEEVDTSIQRALGRCGAMQRLCTSATRAQNGNAESKGQGALNMMRSLSPSALMQRKNPQQQQEEEQKRKQQEISHRPVSQPKPIPRTRLSLPKGGQPVSLPKKPLLPPTHIRSISAEFSSQSLPTSPVPTSTESLRPLSNGADCVEPDYDEPDVSAARESMQLCYAYVDLVGSNRSLPTEHCSSSTSLTSDPGVPLSSRKANRPQVPKKPDVWGIKKSQSMSDLIDDVPQRSSSRPFLSIDSGFNTETNSSSGPIPYKRNSRESPNIWRQMQERGHYMALNTKETDAESYYL